uniref:Uncharacterized protein n=1 Tax=Rhizophora mucronata TaxID=61149 RepID=A0A2P2LRT2_RHIMU
MRLKLKLSPSCKVREEYILTCWGSALNPKSETFNFPKESRRRFSGYKRKR